MGGFLLVPIFFCSISCNSDPSHKGPAYKEIPPIWDKTFSPLVSFSSCIRDLLSVNTKSFRLGINLNVIKTMKNINSQYFLKVRKRSGESSLFLFISIKLEMTAAWYFAEYFIWKY